MEGKRMLDNHQNKAVLWSCKWLGPSRPIGGQPADGDKFLTRRQGPDQPTAGWAINRPNRPLEPDWLTYSIFFWKCVIFRKIIKQFVLFKKNRLILGELRFWPN
jgi:hypothetical protein